MTPRKTTTARLSLFPKPTFNPPALKIPALSSPTRINFSADISSPPPPTPSPWIWGCHSCGSVYRIATTRRCLSCSHRMCSARSTPSSDSPSSSHKRKRKPGGPCPAEFDYRGWSAWGKWRRGDKLASELGMEGHREDSMVLKRHDCFRDCDHPSECHHVRHSAQVSGRAERLRARQGLFGMVEAKLSPVEEVDLGLSMESEAVPLSLEDFATTGAEPDFEDDDEDEEDISTSTTGEDHDLDMEGFYESSSGSSEGDLADFDFDPEKSDPEDEEHTSDKLKEASVNSWKKISQLTGLSYLSIPQPNEDPSAVSFCSPRPPGGGDSEGLLANDQSAGDELVLAARTRAQVRRLVEAQKDAERSVGRSARCRRRKKGAAPAQEEWEVWSDDDKSDDGAHMDDVDLSSPKDQAGVEDDDEADQDLMELLRVRNAFMRGEKSDRA